MLQASLVFISIHVEFVLLGYHYTGHLFKPQLKFCLGTG